MGKWNSPNLRVRVGFQCLGHSNWTICSLLSQFYFLNFPIFVLSYWRPILITPESERLKTGKWNSPNLSVRVGFHCLWHPNWTICSLLSHFCSENVRRSNSLLPQMPNIGKRDSKCLPHCKWRRNRRISAASIFTQPKPFLKGDANFQPNVAKW